MAKKQQVIENTQEALQRENEALRAKLAEQEALAAEVQKTYSASLQSEIAQIRKKGKSTANTIIVKETHDHKNITLWTRDGKPLGPMHPDNAVQLIQERAAAGQFLSVNKPTPEQVQAYMETPEYKKAQKLENERRARKDKSRKAGQIDRLAAEIAKQTGLTREAMMNVLPAHEAKKLSEARA